MNKRQKKKAQKRKQKELNRRREQEALLQSMGMSSTEKALIEQLIKKTEREDEYIELAVQKEMREEAKEAAAQVVVPPPPPQEPEDSTPTPPASEPAQNVQAPKTRSLFQRAREAPLALGSMVTQSLGNIRLNAPTDEQKKTRAEMVKINNQLILTTKIIDANKDELTKLAATDSNVAKILEVTSSDQLKSIKDIQARILAGQEISADESKELIKSLESVTGVISSSQVSLEAKFADIAGNFGSLVLDQNLDREDRRAMLEELVKISKSSDLQTQFSEAQKLTLKELEAMSNSNLNFSDEQNAQLIKIFNQLKSEDLDRVKLRGTLTDLNESMESAVLTNDELKKRLDTKDDKGNTLRDKAGEGIKSLGKTLKAGAIDFLLGNLGLGGLGLGELLGGMGIADVTMLGKGAMKLPGKAVGAVKGVGGLLGKGAGIAGKVGRFAGKAALPLAALMGAFDAYQGWNDAENIAGLEEGQKATLGQKFKAAGSGVVSGLTLGFVDPKTVYKGIEKGMNFLFSPEDGILTKTASFLKKAFELTPLGFVIANFDSIKKGFGSIFGEEGILTKMAKFLIDLPAMMFDTVTEIFESPESLITKVKDSFGMIFDFLFGEEGIFSLTTAKKALKTAAGSVLPEFISKRLETTTADVKNQPTQSASEIAVEPASINHQAAFMAVEDDRRARQAREEQLNATKEQKTVVLPAVAPAPTPAQNSRTAKVEDVQLAVMNAGMAGI